MSRLRYLRGWRFIGGLVVAALAFGGGACSGTKTGSEHFVGTWVYAGMIVPDCGSGSTVAPIDLTGYSTLITATDSSHITVALGTVCNVKFNVDGFTATVQSGQMCTFDLGPPLGMQPVAIKTWTLTSTGADSITSDVTGSAIICTAAGTGTLTRVGDADAGATD